MKEQPRHSIQLVARRTGLTPETIRAWERRYEAIRPTRSPTGRRLYSDDEVERLLLLRKAALAGRRIGVIAGLTTHEVEALIREDEAAAARVPESPEARARGPKAGAYIDACLDAVVALDGARLDLALRRASAELTCADLLDRVVAPLLHQLGNLWGDGSLRIAHEHLGTSRVRTLLESLRAAGPHPTVGPRLVVATPVGQHHDLGSLMVALTAGGRGWRVTHLGPDLPAEEIAVVTERCRARAVALSIVHPDNDPRLATELERLRDLLPAGVDVLAGGRAAGGYGGVLDRAGVQVLGDLDGLRDALDRIRVSAA